VNPFDRIDDEDDLPPVTKLDQGEVASAIVGLLLAIAVALVVSLLMVQSCTRPAPAHQGAPR
jgi:hypothetical protein